MRLTLQKLADLVDDGKLRVHVAERFPFEPVADAHRMLEDGHVGGRIVLTLGKG